MFSRSILPAITVLLLILGSSYYATAQEIHACVVLSDQESTGQFAPSPKFNPPPGAQKAVALGKPGSNNSSYSNFWTAGSTIRVRFLGGSDYVRQRVVRYAREWTRYANVDFSFVDSGSGDIRVSFVENGSSWSLLGRQAQRAPSNRATMNFGWLTERTPEYDFRRTVLHEFGHALGLLHEHQNPTGGIPWDEDEVYSFYRRTQGWDRQTTYHNVIARRQRDETQYSAYDPASIMHYPVDSRLTRGAYEVGMNTAISATDARFIASIYPGRSSNPPTTGGTSSPSRPSPTKPDRPVVTKPSPRPAPPVYRPVEATHELTISNALGQGQRAEVVELSLGGRKHIFRLEEGRRPRQSLRLQLKPGVYEYQVRTASVYAVSKRVRQGNRYVVRRTDRTVYGSGRGQVRVTGDGHLSFFGEYDRERGEMSVYLGAAK